MIKPSTNECNQDLRTWLRKTEITHGKENVKMWTVIWGDRIFRSMETDTNFKDEHQKQSEFPAYQAQEPLQGCIEYRAHPSN